jgi:hypothetical protein
MAAILDGSERCLQLVCSDVYEGTMAPMKLSGVSLVSTEERLSALSPSERKNFLESVAYHKDMLEELAKM